MLLRMALLLMCFAVVRNCERLQIEESPVCVVVLPDCFCYGLLFEPLVLWHGKHYPENMVLVFIVQFLQHNYLADLRFGHLGKSAS